MAATGLIPAHAGKTLSTVAEMPSKRAHPRSRGENRRPRPLGRRRPGSSPLTRGKPSACELHHSWFGLIPAHAGKTRNASRKIPPETAHPRSRGENEEKQSVLPGGDGSSPLTRGKPLFAEAAYTGAGLIPAHAGKTAQPRPRIRPPQAHPRSRGENASRSACMARLMGSSPLTRGKPQARRRDRRRRRLIPAHAGKTVSRPARISGLRAHPRSRGENGLGWPGLAWDGGSSPLTRGKQVRQPLLTWPRGLIPAHAGKTRLRIWHTCPPRAHPRSRGENLIDGIVQSLPAGSSPLTRGKRWPDHWVFRRRGLIPAHAGKTVMPGLPRAESGAHPRSRGENERL